MSEINCAVTVLLLRGKEVGLIRRDENDTLGGLLVAPGGKVELNDGVQIDNVVYYSVEYAAIREVEKEAGIFLTRDDLKYFCSLTLSNNRIVMSFYTWTNEYSDKVVYLSEREVIASNELVPGTQLEILTVIDLLKKRGEW